MAALTAYFDESASDKTKHPLVYSVAGWISTVDEWNKFEVKWRAALEEFNLDWFHMTDYENRESPYDTWPEDQRTPRLKRLHQIIKEHRMYGCAFAFEYEFWKEKERLLPSDSKDAFGPLTLHCMNALSAWRDRQEFRGNEIEYLFAYRDGQGRDLDTCWNLFRKEPKERSFYRPKGHWKRDYACLIPALQAADILAYEFTKHCAGWKRKSWENLELHESNCRAVYFSKDTLITGIELF